MKRISIIGIIIALLTQVAVFAQDASIKVSVKKQVSVGEQFRIAFEANAEGKKFVAPSFEGFTVVGGPFNSSSSSVQIVNGSMSRTVSNTYSYVLRAEREGTFTIGSATYVVDGNEVQSEPCQITVVAGSADPDPVAQGGQQGGQQGASGRQQNTNDPQVSGKDLFLKVIPSKRSAYVGEPVVLTYKIYTRLPVSQLSVSKMPSYGGFWMKEVNDNNALRQSSEVVNGIEYSTAEVKKVVVIPQKSGKLTIEPMGIECIAQIQTQREPRRSNDPFDIFFNDPFFNRSYTNVQKNVETAPITMDVKNLPMDGKPLSFSGAVGNYNFSASIDRNELSTNEAATLTITVSGNGNLELLNLPEPVFPPDFEVYDPKITSSVDANSQGMNGTKKAEYLIIPRRAGDFSIPAIEFSYFNPSKGTYSTLCSQQMDLHVERGAGGESNEGGVFASNQEGIKYLGSDIRHIMANGRLKPTNTHFFASIPYFIMLTALFLLFIVASILVKKRRQYKQDVVLVRNRQATKVAKGRLKNAFKYLKDNDQNHYYEEMSQALWGYISDKLGIERSVLSMDTVKSAMTEKGIDEALANQFVDTLNTCEFARFAPGDATAKMEDLYHKGLDVIMKVEKTI
ncbi:MAG: protein BatD [Bacteroidales bacterium]|nr:protein BatD [Bacteroidales bacterium]